MNCLPRSLRFTPKSSLSNFTRTQTTTYRLSQRVAYSTTKMALQKPNTDVPENKMVYFPQMTTSLPSESGEFRRVLWTGLYSQLVLMTVPVGGDIGDEVRFKRKMSVFAALTSLAETYRRSDPHIHLRPWKGHDRRQRPGCQGRRSDNSACRDTASICEYWSYTSYLVHRVQPC